MLMFIISVEIIVICNVSQVQAKESIQWPRCLSFTYIKMLLIHNVPTVRQMLHNPSIHKATKQCMYDNPSMIKVSLQHFGISMQFTERLCSFPSTN